MRSIQNRILFFTLVPCFLICGALSGFIVHRVYKIQLNEAELQIVPIFLSVGISFLICFVVFSLLFMYLSRSIAAPLKRLAEAGESIVSGNWDINSVVNSKDEMGIISRSLVRMAEQFKTGKILQERYHDRFGIVMRLHYALFYSSTLNDAFDAMLNEISGYYNVYKSSLIVLIKDNPRIVSLYPLTKREEGNSDFFAHGQVVKLIEGKKHLTMNGSALKDAKFPFIGFNTKSMCILPLRVSNVLCGYVIMEGKGEGMLVHNDTTLIFLGDTFSYLISIKMDKGQKAKSIWQKETPAPAVEETDKQDLSLTEDGNDFFEKAKNIKNLDVDKGILLVGGEKKKYTELLEITIKGISDSINKLRRFHAEDISAFAIEIHGLKAALYNIGAETLGDEARQLEFAAKSDDDSYCKENYPFFEEKLRIFSRNLAALFPGQKRNVRDGTIEELEEALVHAGKACDTFDIAAVNSLLAPLVYLRWDDKTIQKNFNDILEDMENLEYGGMTGKISRLLEYIRNKEG